MAKLIERLTPLKISKAKGPGMYPDGGGLYLQVRGRSRSWLYRYKVGAKQKLMGLGSYPTTTLERARELATAARNHRLAGRDPLQARDAAVAAERAAEARSKPFAECVRFYTEAMAAQWRNPKHRQQWANTLRDYAEPKLGKLPVSAITTELVMEVLRPIWSEKTETASRVRGRIEAVWDWAKVNGYCAGENPARWRGHLDKLLPRRSKVRKVRHHAALPYPELPAFMTALRKENGTAARCLEFIVLTVSRSGAAFGAMLDEIDRGKRMWTIPGEHMKAGRKHRVPLVARALDVTDSVTRSKDDVLLFPGQKRRKPITEAALRAVLAKLGADAYTIHGFRSTFRDWVGERTNFPRELAEMALAHAIEDETEAAYARGDLFEKRRKLMDAWATYCASKPVKAGEVVPFKVVS